MPNHFQAPNTRLATYGSLAPGRVNHHQLEMMRGHWSTGTVRGNLHNSGWGSALGFPGLQLDPTGAFIDVHIFESEDLPQHWARLDEFEGPGYRRAVARVTTPTGELGAWIYVLAN